MKIKPVGSRIYIRLLAIQENITTGGIYLPDKHSEQSRIGEIIDMGDDVDFDRFAIGDKVLINWTAGIPLHIVTQGILKDTDRIITEEEIMAKIEE